MIKVIRDKETNLVIGIESDSGDIIKEAEAFERIMKAEAAKTVDIKNANTKRVVDIINSFASLSVYSDQAYQHDLELQEMKEFYNNLDLSEGLKTSFKQEEK